MVCLLGCKGSDGGDADRGLVGYCNQSISEGKEKVDGDLSHLVFWKV